MTMPNLGDQPKWGLSRRRMLQSIGGGFGTLGLTGVLADADLLGPTSLRVEESSAQRPLALNPLAPRPAHFCPRAKRVTAHPQRTRRHSLSPWNRWAGGVSKLQPEELRTNACPHYLASLK